MDSEHNILGAVKKIMLSCAFVFKKKKGCAEETTELYAPFSYQPINKRRWKQ